MTAMPLVVIGASAGGVEAVARILSELPEELPAAVLVVIHTAPAPNQLAGVLARSTRLEVLEAADGARIEQGRVYVAPPDRHLLVEDGRARVVRGPHENRQRPAIDPLFRSAAFARGARVVAVVLTGSLDDGAAGSAAVSRLGGHVLVQDPDEAPYPSMPLNAIAVDDPEHVLPLARMAPSIVELVERTSVTAEQAPGRRLDETDDEVFHELAPFACPSCGGTLWKGGSDEELRFRCRIGHAFGAAGLLEEQSDQLDRALAEALRALEERADLARRVARRLRTQGLDKRAARFEEIQQESERHALVIRNVLLHREGGGAQSEE